MLTIQTSANRHYVAGNTYPVREHLRSAGLKWDPTAKAWWTSDRDVATRTVAALSSKTQPPAAVTAKANVSTVKKAAPRKRCWECGCLFTRADARIADGDWGDSYCGC